MEQSLNVWSRVKALPWLAIGGGLAACLVLVAVVAPLRRAVANVTSRAILVVASPLAPDIKGFEDLPDASRVLARDGAEVGLLGTEQRDPVRLGQLPSHVTQAVLAAEDADFYSHSGVDPSAVFRAMINSARGETQGGSTITQQLAKLRPSSASSKRSSTPASWRASTRRTSCSSATSTRSTSATAPTGSPSPPSRSSGSRPRS
jgi:membrane peptidoglycan carboxypeptidase